MSIKKKDDGAWQKEESGKVLSSYFCHIPTLSVLHNFFGFCERTREPNDSHGTFLYNLLNHRNYIIFTCSQFTTESVSEGMSNFTQPGCVTNIVAGNECSSASVYRSISQDRLYYCYWCCYLVRHNWILKNNITHSSCWVLTFLSGYWWTFK